MKRIFRLFFISLILLICAVFDRPVVFATENSDDFSRPIYSLQQINEGALGDIITFNSIKITESDYEWYKKATGNEIPEGTIRNETNFVGAREYTGINAGAQNVWEGTEITVTDGSIYIVRLYIHNNNPKGEACAAENTQVRFYVPYGSAASQTIDGYISSSNATPNQYLDDVVMKSADGTPFHLEYISGSALLENGGCAKGAGVQLPDSITNQGNPTNKVEDEWTLIGYDALNGRMPGCYQYTNYVSIEVKVVFDYEFSVETKVRLADNDDKTWQDAIEAKVGDKVEFQFQYMNTGDYKQEGVVVQDLLPSNLRYVDGSAKLYNDVYPNGATMKDGTVIFRGGNIGNYPAGVNAFVRFTAEVVDDNLACGSNTLVNWAQVRVGDIIVQDEARVYIQKNTGYIFAAIIILLILILLCLIIIVIVLKRMWRKAHQSS